MTTSRWRRPRRQNVRVPPCLPDVMRFDLDPATPAWPALPPCLPAAAVVKECSSCRKTGAKLRCTKCLKVVYCNRECQVRLCRVCCVLGGERGGGEAGHTLLLQF